MIAGSMRPRGIPSMSIIAGAMGLLVLLLAAATAQEPVTQTPIMNWTQYNASLASYFVQYFTLGHQVRVLSSPGLFVVCRSCR